MAEDAATPTAAAPTADTSLELEPSCVAEIIALARSAPTGPRDPHSKSSLREVYEADVACISGHLAAMQTHVYPLARKVLPDGRSVTAGLALLTREHERLLRVVHAHLRGDVHTSNDAMKQLQIQLGKLVAELQAAEEQLAERLEAVLSPAAISRLTEQLARAGAHGPTRPHPHATHRMGLRRLSFRLCSLFDATIDVMESRTLIAG